MYQMNGPRCDVGSSCLDSDSADLERHLPPHELTLLRAERAEAALLTGPSNLVSVLHGSGVSGAAPSPVPLMLSNAHLPGTSTYVSAKAPLPLSGLLASSANKDALVQQQPQPHDLPLPSAGGNPTGPALLDPLAGLTGLLADAAQDWNPYGRPDANGAMVGGSVALRLEELHTAMPDITQHWLTAGRPRVVTISNAIMAVGTSLGSALVFQLPVSGANAAAGTGHGGAAGGGGAHPQGASHGGVWSQGGLEHVGLPHYVGSGGAGGGGVSGASLPLSALGGSGPAGPGGGNSSGAIVVVGEPRSEAEAVTALALSTVTGQGDPLWLLVGHASGLVAAWDLQRRPPKQVALITGQHDLPIVHVSFFPGRGASMALSADRRGNLVLHTFTHIVLKTAVASRTVLGGNMGIIGTIVHLTPFFASSAMPPPTAAQPQVVPAAMAGATATASAAPPPPPQSPAGAGTSAGTAALAQPGARVGDGMVALCATTGCHIGRFKPSGELIPLYSIPRPASASTPSIPCAAWLPHQRRSARPPPVAVAAAEDNSSVVITAICAVLAVGWHDEVLFVDVPLVGDHNSPPPPPSTTEASSSGSSLPGVSAAAPPLQSAPGEQQQTTVQPVTQAPQQQTGPARRSFLRAAAAFTGVARGAATAAVAAAANAAAAASAATSTALAVGASGQALLDAQAASALAHRLPLSVARIWNTTSITKSRSGTADVVLSVVGLHWYDSDALGVVLLLGLAMRLVVVDLELEVREQVDCIDTPYISGLMPPAPHGGAPTAPDTLAGSGARVVLLGNSSTLYCSRLLTWQERLRTLADIGKWKLGLRFALDFYKLHLARAAVAMAAASATVGPIRGPLMAAGAAADGSYPSALRGWMGSLAVGFVKSALGTALQAASAQGMAQLRHLEQLPAPVVRQLREATAVAVLACLAAGREQLLFDTVFPLCRDAGAAGPLVEAVEVAVLAGALPRPAPELVQALVEHLAVGLARPDRVERCVLHFDIASLDLDQVLRLCEAHQLHSASAAIYNRLHDYKRPLLDMLAAAAGLEPAISSERAPGKEPSPDLLPPPPPGASSMPAAPDKERRRRVAGFKLLVYLRCIFRRQAFPPGTGVLPDIIPGAGRRGIAGGPDDVKAQLLGLLLFLEPKDLAREWRRPLEQLPSVLLTGPHPALRVLLSIDVAAAVSVLGGAVAGWDAVETDLREAAGRPAAELDSVLVATQVLVNAFIQLLESENSGTNIAAKSETDGSEVMLDFIAGLLAAGRVVVRPSFALRLLRRVAYKAIALIVEDEGAASGREGRGDGASERQREALEELFERLVTVVGVNSRDSRFDPEKLSVQEAEAALDMAHRASFPRALATLHHLRGNYLAALACHLKLPPRWGRFSSGDNVSGKDVDMAKVAGSGDETRSGALSAFTYVREFLGNGGGATAEQRAAMYDALLEAAPELVAADPLATAQILLAHYPGESQAAAFLERLSGDRRLQFDFLTAAVHHKNALAQDLGGGQDDGENDVPHGQRMLCNSYSVAGLHTMPTVAMAALGAWMSQSALANTYVQLMCEFEPCAVLPFLEQHSEYDVRHCIGLCSTAGVWDAEAYLYERLGEQEAALVLHLRNVERRNRELDEAVRSGVIQSYHVGTTAGLVFFDHLAWLLELSPRLALLMQGSLGRHAAEAAEWAHRGQRTADTPSLLSPTIVTGSTGSGSQDPRLLSTPQHQSAGNALGASGPPRELLRAWEALGRAVAFCGRCFKQQQKQQQQQRSSQSQLRFDAVVSAAASWPESPSEIASGSETRPCPSPSHCWYALLHAYVEELQRRRSRCSPGASPGTENGQGGSNAMASGPVRAHPVVTGFDAAEMVAETAALAAAGNAVAISECQERVLRQVFGVFLEEVINRMSDYVPPSEVVRHIIDTYGSQDFGGFRSTLLGLLGSCAYEQAIMCSAQRLIRRGVFASHQQRLALVAGCLPSAALRTKPHHGEIEYMGTAAALTASGIDPEVGSAIGGGGGTEAAGGSGAWMPSSVVTTTSPAAAAPFWRLHAEGRSGGGGLSDSTAFSRGASAALVTTTPQGVPLAPAGDLRGLRADGQFLAALQASGGMGDPVRGATGPVIRSGMQVAAGSGRFLMKSPWRPATSAAAVSGSVAEADSASRAGAAVSDESLICGKGKSSGPAIERGSLDIDNLLDWTRAFGR